VYDPRPKGFTLPAQAIHHVDLAVKDVDRSVAFYLGLLGPLGVEVTDRFATYRGTEEVVYLTVGGQALGFRQADAGAHRYYEVGLEHFAIRVDTREELEQTYERSVGVGARIQFPSSGGSGHPGLLGFFRVRPRWLSPGDRMVAG
jgi:catechol 2,3-dioxygenase-like lactoylglutathione lyase family enzyme